MQRDGCRKTLRRKTYVLTETKPAVQYLDDTALSKDSTVPKLFGIRLISVHIFQCVPWLSQAAEDGLNHGFGFAVIERAVSRKQTKDHRSVDQVEHDFSIDLFSNLTAVDAAPPHDTRRISPCIKKSLPKQRQKPRVALALCNEL